MDAHSRGACHSGEPVAMPSVEAGTQVGASGMRQRIPLQKGNGMRRRMDHFQPNSAG
jgi:hypothetical protein